MGAGWQMEGSTAATAFSLGSPRCYAVYRRWLAPKLTADRLKLFASRFPLIAYSL